MVGVVYPNIDTLYETHECGSYVLQALCYRRIRVLTAVETFFLPPALAPPL